ncbi:TVP38/TMEM64 family protein [Slackia sp.]|uniref:TVP38/TMEM64 family protein n=1 Tax=Slackia sp. TaxID=2049041 RepID=UPI002E782B8A|nr:TVP38/TMEM64 family protein [Slackia sp.]MEE0519297.1 TVP38/TMEM64 family protein [Slackia sp.]
MGEKRSGKTGSIRLKMERIEERKESFVELQEERFGELEEKLEKPVSNRPALARLTKADLFKFGGLIAFFVLMAVVCVAIAPLILELTEPGGVERVVQDVRNAGPGGVLILLGMQFLQVVVAFIPGEVVQVAAGMMYGPWGGAAVVLAGCIISSAFVFFIVHKLGAPFVRAMIPEKWMGKLEDFEETDKLDVMVFVLFLIPGLPKDVFTYLVPLTDMSMRNFLVLSTVGRIPGILMSTLAADGLMEGDIMRSVLLFLVAAGIAALAIVFHEKIMHAFAKKK